MCQLPARADPVRRVLGVDVGRRVDRDAGRWYRSGPCQAGRFRPVGPAYGRLASASSASLLQIDGYSHEAYVPAPQLEPCPDPWVPRPYGDPRWSQGDRSAASPRPEAPRRVGRRQMKREGFPAAVRLRKRREFLQIQGAGVKHHLRHFLVFVSTTAIRSDVPASASSARLGVTVTRKVGPAVVRNRIRRLVREVFRRKRDSFRAGCDMVWVAKQSAASVSYAEVAADMDALARRASRQPPNPSGVMC